MKVCTSDNCFFVDCLQSLDNFTKDKKSNDGLSFWCKSCSKRYNLSHREEIKEYYKRYRLKRQKELKEYNERYRLKRKEEIREYKKQYRLEHQQETKEYNKQYKLSHREECNEYEKQRKKEDINFKIARNLRSRLYNALNGNYKSGSAVADLEMTISDLKTYLEQKFYLNPKTGEMMSWENYGFYGWHIDHIIPLASFNLTDSKQVKKACHYTNLQPLWCFENISKGDKRLDKYFGIEMYVK